MITSEHGFGRGREGHLAEGSKSPNVKSVEIWKTVERPWEGEGPSGCLVAEGALGRKKPSSTREGWRKRPRPSLKEGLRGVRRASEATKRQRLDQAEDG